jgi:site-specific DNA recombinase
MFASGDYGLVTISRHLEEHRILTATGRQRWDSDRIKSILKNETYTGTRYFNRMTRIKKGDRQGKKLIRGQWVYRDRPDWIAVPVPAIVSRELFDTVQAKLRGHDARYCQPVTHYLLSGLVQCGVCGSGCSSFRRWQKVVRPSGKVSVYHHAAYRCNRRARENNHDRTRIERCRNSVISTHILEGKVFEMIRDTMLDPGKLRCCIESGVGLDDRSTAQELTRVARKIGALDDERRTLISRYAADQMTGDEYIAANRALDEKLERLMRAKAKLATALRPTHHEDFVDASVRQFCATAKARLQTCSDFDANRQFLLDHVERVIYDRYNVTIVGSAPCEQSPGKASSHFASKARST